MENLPWISLFICSILLVIDIYLKIRPNKKLVGYFVILRDGNEPPYIFLELSKSIEEIEKLDEVLIGVRK